MRVIHIITSLEDGGAEALLYRMCLAMTSHCHIVISLKNGGKYGPLLEDAGIKVYHLNMLGLVSFLPSFLRLYNILKLEEPDIVQTWLYHADLFGGLCARKSLSVCYHYFHSGSLKRSYVARKLPWIFMRKWVIAQVNSFSYTMVTTQQFLDRKKIAAQKYVVN